MEFLTGGIVDSSPAISSGVVYIGSTDHKMYALGGAKGLKKWSFTADDAVHSSPAVAGSRVYFGSAHGTVYALNAKTGKKVWSVSTGGAVDSLLPWSAALSTSGRATARYTRSMPQPGRSSGPAPLRARWCIPRGGERTRLHRLQ